VIFELLRWWYGPGWVLAFKRINTRTANVAHAFSAGTLLKTLFAPWKRIQYQGKSFDDKVRAFTDNLVSRVVGFTVRIGVLIAAFVMIIGSLIMGTAIAIVWPLVPALIVYSAFKGVF
jgi:hypothetical protein